MSRNLEPEYPMDPKLREFLEVFREVPQRDGQAADRTRLKYLTEVSEIFEQQSRPTQEKAQKPDKSLKSSNWFSLSALPRRLAFTSLLAIVAIAIVLFGSAGVTAYASQSSLPGDALYPVKTGLELTQASLARDAAIQAQLYLSFAERRLDEISQLVAEGRFDDIDRAIFEFETNVQRAIDTINTVSAGDPAKAQEIASQVSSALSRYAVILKAFLSAVPDTVKPSVLKAILKSETEGTGEMEFQGLVEKVTPDGWTIAGRAIKASPLTEIKGRISVGASVEVHVLVSDDGTLIAREIKVLSPATDNVNDNSSTEAINSNQNGSLDNLSGNTNQSSGQSNTNSSQNTNQNDNDNDDDDSGKGSKSNSNRNDNDDDENDNDDDDDD